MRRKENQEEMSGVTVGLLRGSKSTPPPPLRGLACGTTERDRRLSAHQRVSHDVCGLRSRASRSDPPELDWMEPFWNSRSHGLATVVLWSVPAFHPVKPRRIPRSFGKARVARRHHYLEAGETGGLGSHSVPPAGISSLHLGTTFESWQET